MSEIICQFCGATTEWYDGKIKPHGRGLPSNQIGPTCPASGCVAREAGSPRDCPRCGVPLSLAVRSRPSTNERHHSPEECIVELRRRIEALEEKRLKLTKGQAQQAVGIMRSELRERLGIHIHTEGVPSHDIFRAAVVARLQGLVPWDECPCGGLLRLDGACRDCNERKARP